MTKSKVTLKGVYVMNAIEKAKKDRAELAMEYNVSESAIVWIGNNKYIVIKDGKEIRI